jgi:hypothetical protein
MIGSILLAAACLDVPPATDVAYAVLIGSSSWSCAGERDAASARAARGKDGDVIWFRLDRQAYALRDDADLDDMAAILQPYAEIEARCIGLDEKIGEYDAELSRLDAERSRLDEKLARYAPGSEKNLAVSAEAAAVNERRRTLGKTRDEIAPQRERLATDLTRAFGDAQRRLGLLIERALAHGTAQQIVD